jgi:hypothetical protein
MAVSADNYLSRIDGKTRHAFRLADTPARTVGRCRRIDLNPAADPHPAFLLAFLCAGHPVPVTGYYGIPCHALSTRLHLRSRNQYQPRLKMSVPAQSAKNQT